MKRIKLMLASLSIFMMFTSNAGAIESLVNSVLVGCESELNSYCKNVTPGDGRILACLFAHNDKISGRCEYALYDAAVQLERLVAALSYVANECEDDLEKFCSAVSAGQGRLAECLSQNRDRISNRCDRAIQDVDMKLSR